MQATDQAFFEAYKRLDRLCSDAFSCRNGVTAYIDEMDRCSPRGRRLVPGWEQDLSTLKALRHLRNRMAHELDTDGVCTEADAAEAGGACAHPFRRRPACAPEPDGSFGEKAAHSAEAGERVPRFREAGKTGAEHMDRHCDHRRGDLSDCTGSDNFPLNSEKVILLQKAKIGCAVLSGQAHPIFMPDEVTR